MVSADTTLLEFTVIQVIRSLTFEGCLAFPHWIQEHAKVSEPKTRIQFAHASKMKDNMELESAMSSSRRVIKDGRQDGKRKDPKMAYREP
ncbi:hypothetical protein PtA15_2A165 [Puccinia triticina]|uniref:Uncharacterized protein n=1 Tax=Puccinia triticina TaxID=208348 RepID=A0ABY7CGC1_9BASI|nr:uncharacterized protein PtA15_2A165 [Puccinia triticina]WAQ81852.1 hypothetical protein PtA15_2A165 [Puccinia triticina]